MMRTAIAALALTVAHSLAQTTSTVPSPAAPVAPVTVPFKWITLPAGERASIIESLPHDSACPHGFSRHDDVCVTSVQFYKLPGPLTCRQSKEADAQGFQLIVCRFRIDGKPIAAE